MFRADDRAVSEQIGMILMFGFLVVSMATYQATVVPAANEEVEFRHSERVQADLVTLDGAVDRAAAGDSASTQIEVGTRYPDRTFFVNPSPASGSLRSERAGTVEIDNAVAVEDAETADYWNGTATRTFTTDRVRYRASYHEYGNAPETLVEHGVVVGRFDDGTELARTEQTLVRGTDIDLVALTASLSYAGSSERSVAIRPISPAAETVTVTGDGDPVVLRLPTALDQSTWRDLLADQRSDAGGHVTGVSVSDGTVTIELDGNESYRLRMAKTAVGADAETPAAYLTTVEGSTVRVSAAGDDIAVEARNGFNNPTGGTTVEVIDGEELVDRSNATTGADGHAMFAYSGEGEGTLVLRLEGGSGAAETVELSIRRSGTDGGSGTGGGLEITDSARAFDSPDDGSTPGGFDLVLRNTHLGEATVTQVRVVPEAHWVEGLSDVVSGEGERRSELHLEALGNGTDGTVEAPLAWGSTQKEFLYVSGRGIVLAPGTSTRERTYDVEENGYGFTETDVYGTPTIPADERVRLSFAEFYRVYGGGYSNVDASEHDFTVAVTYEVDGVERTEMFVVRPLPPT